MKNGICRFDLEGKLMDTVDYLKFIHNRLSPLDYRFTGLTAVNLYGYGISTNVFDVAVESDEVVEKACSMLDLEYNGEFDPYVYKGSNYYVRIQGDITGEPYVHPLNLWLHSKELLVRRLEIYSLYEPRAIQACAWIALTQTPEMAKKYKAYWNRL